jgi:hypothetical protein
MKIKKILLSFCRLAVAALIVFGRSIVTRMTGNSHFTTPNPALADVTTAIDDLEEKAALALEGGKTATSDQKKAKKKVNDLLRKLAWYVEGVAEGDENILTSSGFNLSKDPEPSQHDAFFVLAGISSGCVLIGCFAYTGARSYLWFRSADKNLPAAEKDWILAGSSTQRKTTLCNLASGQTYWFSYRAVTPQGMMEWSDPIQFYVQ